MLPDTERLRRASLIQRVYNTRRSVSVDNLTLYVLERQAQSAPRLPLTGFVVGKKVHPEATRRNRAKRRVREAYRQLRADGESCEALSIKRWYALVWVIQGDVISKNWDEVKESVLGCLTRARDKYGDKRAQRK